ncbi:MAG: type 1 glutamine amidotransferase [Terriglobales bacterium]
MATNRSSQPLPWAVVQHVAWEGPGIIADALREGGFAWDLYRMDQNAALPDAGAIAGLIVMGGTMGVYDADQHPHLRAEIALLAACAGKAIPVLGVCLGAQLLAAALGATVERGPVLEIGAGEVTLTPAGRADPVLAEAASDGRLAVVHWHQDTFPLPAGATLLASSPLYARQAFRAGACAYGLQFHCEVDAPLAAAWRDHGLALEAVEVDRIAGAGRRLLDAFLAIAVSG